MMSVRLDSPYRGLMPYTEAEYAYFFGRTQEIATVAANLEVARLTLLYGPSGVGKTSLLRAGVLYQLQQQAQANFTAIGRAEIIPIYFNRWQQEPLLGLTQTIQQTIQPYTKTNGDALGATQNLPPFPTLLRQASAQTQSDLLLILDQFEEYFLYAAPAGVANVADALVQAINSPDLRANFLLSLREDALARLDLFKGRIPFLLDNRLSIERLSREAARDAIEKPLAQYSQEYGQIVTIETALTEAILDQLSEGQTGLVRQGTGIERSGSQQIETPYLQLVLSRLWQEEQQQGSTVLCAATLSALGNTGNIVANYLNESMAALSEHEQMLAARCFDRLITPSGTKIALSLADFTRYTGANQSSVEQLVQTLLRQRLLQVTPSLNNENRYEITHDVLGQAILAWQERYQATQSEALRLKQEQVARGEAERQRLEAEKRAAAERRYSQRLRQLVWGLITLIFFALAATAFAVVQARLAMGMTLNTQARSFLSEQNLRMATLLAIEASPFNQTQGEQILNEIPVEIPLYPAQQFLGHQGAVWGVAWSPKGDLLASASWDKTIRVWNVESGKDVRSILGHDAAVSSVAWSPNGDQLASASWDKTVILWDVTSGKKLRTLKGHSDNVNSVAWSLDGRYLASASSDNTVILWDATCGKKLRTLKGHSDSVNSVAWSSDGLYLASASTDLQILIWDVFSGEIVQTLLGHSDTVTGVAWNRNGDNLASASSDMTVIVWNIANGTIERILRGHKDTVYGVAWNYDGTKLASVSADKSIIIWNMTGGKDAHIFQGQSESINGVAWNPDGQHLASASSDNTVMVWNLKVGKKALAIGVHGGLIDSIAWSPKGNQIASTSIDDKVIVWDAFSGDEVLTLPFQRKTFTNTKQIASVVWSPSGRLLAFAPDDTRVVVWDTISNTQTQIPQDHSSPISGVTWSPDDRKLASSSRDGKTNIRNIEDIWNLENDKEPQTLDLRKTQKLKLTPQSSLSTPDLSSVFGINDVAWNPNQQKLALALSNGTVGIWDTAANTELRTLQGHRTEVLTVAWSPDGKHLASGSADNSIIVWDMTKSERVFDLQGHTAAVIKLVWNPNGHELASAALNNTVIVWDVLYGENIHHLKWLTRDVYDMTWSPDGKWLAMASSDGIARLFPQSYMKPPCQWAQSNLTLAEWIQSRGWALYRPTCPEYPSPVLPGILESLGNDSRLLLLTIHGRVLLTCLVMLSLFFIVWRIWRVRWVHQYI